MHTSTILASVFMLLTTSLLSQSNLTCMNVKQSDSSSTSIKMRGSGQTCGPFPLIVSKTGFQMKVYTPHKSTDSSLGSLQIYFGAFSVPFSFANEGVTVTVLTKDDTRLGNAKLDVTTIEIQPDGTGFVVPRKNNNASVKFPPLVEFQQHNENEVTIDLKIEWTDINDEFIIELPSHANNDASTSPMSTTSTPTSTKTVNYTEKNETTTTVFDIPTSSAHKNSNATSKVSWIIIAAVVGSVFVIIAIAAVIGAVYITQRIRRKRSATGLLATPTTRVTYPSNEIYRFNIPIDPKSKITDHGINFNDYLAVVPAYPEEIREFESAEKKKKDEMYLGFLGRIQIAERTENKGSK